MKIKLMRKGAQVPTYSYEDAECFDFYNPEWFQIESGETKVISLGVAMELPITKAMDIRGRSSLNALGVVVLLGTVDNDYRGEVFATIINLSGKRRAFFRGDRIAQGWLRDRVEQVSFEVVDELSETERGEKGKGSTGD